MGASNSDCACKLFTPDTPIKPNIEQNRDRKFTHHHPVHSSDYGEEDDHDEYESSASSRHHSSDSEDSSSSDPDSSSVPHRNSRKHQDKRKRKKTKSSSGSNKKSKSKRKHKHKHKKKHKKKHRTRTPSPSPSTSSSSSSSIAHPSSSSKRRRTKHQTEPKRNTTRKIRYSDASDKSSTYQLIKRPTKTLNCYKPNDISTTYALPMAAMSDLDEDDEAMLEQLTMVAHTEPVTEHESGTVRMHTVQSLNELISEYEQHSEAPEAASPASTAPMPREFPRIVVNAHNDVSFHDHEQQPQPTNVSPGSAISSARTPKSTPVAVEHESNVHGLEFGRMRSDPLSMAPVKRYSFVRNGQRLKNSSMSSDSSEPEPMQVNIKRARSVGAAGPLRRLQDHPSLESELSSVSQQLPALNGRGSGNSEEYTASSGSGRRSNRSSSKKQKLDPYRGHQGVYAASSTPNLHQGSGHKSSYSMDHVQSVQSFWIDAKAKENELKHNINKRNSVNWSLDRIDAESEEMKKQILSLKQYTNSRSSTNWIDIAELQED